MAKAHRGTHEGSLLRKLDAFLRGFPDSLRMDLISLGPFTSHSERTWKSNPGPLTWRPGVTDCGIRPTRLLVKKYGLILYIS